MSNAPLRLGINNQVPLCTLTATPAAANDVDFLKNMWRARQAKWIDFSNTTVVIEGVLDEPMTADFFAIPGHNLGVGSSVKLEMFATDVSTTDLIGMDFEDVETPESLALWRSGTDAYGEVVGATMENIYARWFDAPIEWQKFKLHITHGYDTSAPVANTTPRQDPGDGIISLEAESGTISNVSGNTWTVTADGTASGGFMAEKTGSNFYWSANSGPRITYVFTAALSGAFSMWARVKTASGANSFYTVFDGSSKNHVLDLNSSWHWVELRTVTLTAETDHTVVVAGRDYSFEIDKIEIRPPDGLVPTGESEPESDVGTVTSSDNVALRAIMMGEKLEFDRNFSHGASMQFVTDPDLIESASGYHSPGKLQLRSRKMGVQMNMLTPADRLRLVDMERSHANIPFLVSAYPAESEWVTQAHTMLGMFNNALNYEHRTLDIYGAQLIIYEV